MGKDFDPEDGFGGLRTLGARVEDAACAMHIERTTELSSSTIEEVLFLEGSYL